MIYRHFVKPILDFISALLILFTLTPLWLTIFLLLLIFHGGTIFFRQIRPGIEGKEFEILKFSTMNNHRNPSGELLPDEMRLTGIGRWLRKTSLDELPQLLNVLKGEMSIVGPRPLLTEYLELYSTEQNRRHDLRPGITGWAQVNGRNTISWEQKFLLDNWYVNHQNFIVDLKILFLTLKNVVSAKGINSSGAATSIKFNGKN